jgi:hypothetical protein
LVILLRTEGPKKLKDGMWCRLRTGSEDGYSDISGIEQMFGGVKVASRETKA